MVASSINDSLVRDAMSFMRAIFGKTEIQIGRVIPRCSPSNATEDAFESYPFIITQ